jgi:hypothetical protein
MKTTRRRNRWIMGTFVGTAAIAVAIDHTRHRLPEPAPAEHSASTPGQAAVVIVGGDTETPCGLDASPCSLDDSPCALDQTPTTADESPCSL